EPVERIQPGRLANPHFLLPSQIRPHCLTVAACVAGNSRDRPSPLLQRMNLHIFLRCQHPGWLLSVSLVVADSKPGGEPPRSPVSPDWRVGNISEQVWGELRERGQAHARRRMIAFYTYCADAHVPELTRLAMTVSRWSELIFNYHRTGRASNGKTENAHMLIEKTRRQAHGFRNIDNYRRRIIGRHGIKWDTQPVRRIRGRQPRFIA